MRLDNIAGPLAMSAVMQIAMNAEELVTGIAYPDPNRQNRIVWRIVPSPQTANAAKNIHGQVAFGLTTPPGDNRRGRRHGCQPTYDCLESEAKGRRVRRLLTWLIENVIVCLRPLPQAAPGSALFQTNITIRPTAARSGRSTQSPPS